MRIALVSRELYPYLGGGIAPIVAAAARQLAEVAEVTVVTSAAHRAEHEPLVAAEDPRLLPPDVRLAWVPEPDGADCGGYFSYMHAYSARVHGVLRDVYGSRGPDLIEFCDYLGEGFVTVQAAHTHARWLRETLVCVRLHTTSELCAVLDGHLPDDLGTVAVHEAERFVLRHADRILWSGGDVLGTYERYYGADRLASAVKIPDGFLVEHDPGDDRSGAPQGAEPLRLLFLGRAERRKGVQNLLRAFTALERDDVELTLLGGDTQTGPLGGSLRTQLQLAAGADPRITFLDPVPRDQVSGAIRHAHVVLVPSLWECWPNVAREALLHNRPVLGTPVGGLTELVQPGRSGWLARDTSPEALAEAIDRLADSRDEVRELIDDGRPRRVVHELADADRLRKQYAGLAAEAASLAAEAVPRPAKRTVQEPLVSVIVPYFHLESVVGDTLRSALSQTHPNVEVVVVNDGSLREQDTPLYELARELPITLVTQVNSGLGPARNFGISQSRGEYVLPLDADDLISPEFVERCVDALQRDADLAYVTTWVEYMKPDATPIVDEMGGYMPFGNWTRLIRRNNVAGTCSAVFRRRLFEQGFRYSPDLTSYEDWFLYLELHDAGHFGGVIPERLFHYRVRDNSMMRQIGAKRLQRIAEEIAAHVREQEVRWVAPSTGALG